MISQNCRFCFIAQGVVGFGSGVLVAALAVDFILAVGEPDHEHACGKDYTGCDQ